MTAAAAVGLAPTTAFAEGVVELPTVSCSWAVVTLCVEQYCINVYGEGLYVDQVSGELETVARGPAPVEGAEVNLTGAQEDGTPYDETGGGGRRTELGHSVVRTPPQLRGRQRPLHPGPGGGDRLLRSDLRGDPRLTRALRGWRLVVEGGCSVPRQAL